MQPSILFFFKPELLNTTHRLLLPQNTNLWYFGRFPNFTFKAFLSLLTHKNKSFFILLNIFYKWHSILPLSQLTTRHTPPLIRLGPIHFFPLPSSLLCFTFCFYIFFSLLENKICWLHSPPKKAYSCCQSPNKTAFWNESLRYFPTASTKYQKRKDESYSFLVKKSYPLFCKKPFFGLQLCKILIGVNSWYKLGLAVFFSCRQAVSSQDISCKRSEVRKNKQILED